jgi:hypothetical protein
MEARVWGLQVASGEHLFLLYSLFSFFFLPFVHFHSEELSASVQTNANCAFCEGPPEVGACSDHGHTYMTITVWIQSCKAPVHASGVSYAPLA